MKIRILKRKKILGAIQDLPAKQHSQSSPILVEMGWIGCAIQQATSKWLPQSFTYFQHFFYSNKGSNKTLLPTKFQDLFLMVYVGGVLCDKQLRIWVSVKAKCFLIVICFHNFLISFSVNQSHLYVRRKMCCCRRWSCG